MAERSYNTVPKEIYSGLLVTENHNITPQESYDSDSFTEARQFRRRILRSCATHLPMRVHISEEAHSYSITDHTLKIVWADDLTLGGSQELLDDIAYLFGNKGLSEYVEAVEASFNARRTGQKKIHLSMRENPKQEDDMSRYIPVVMTMTFGYCSHGKIFELYIEPF